MTILVGGITPRNDRNGAQAAKWVNNQTYNVEQAARSVHTPESIMIDIAQNGTGRVIGFLAANKGITPNVVDAIWDNKPTFEIKKKLASNPNTPEEILRELAHDSFGGAVLAEKITNRPNLSNDLAVNIIEAYFIGNKYEIYSGNGSSFFLSQPSFIFSPEPSKKLLKLINKLGVHFFLHSLSVLNNREFVLNYYLKHQKEIVDYLNHKFGLNLTTKLDFESQLAVYRVVRAKYTN